MRGQQHAQIAAAQLSCAPGVPLYGIDHLNNATGVPQNAVVNEANVQSVSGLSPDAFLATADTAINQAPGYFGVQQEISPTLTLTADYYHRNINHILGVRVTNLTFESREVGNPTTYTNGTQRVLGYGPWLGGFFDGLTIELAKRMSHHFQGFPCIYLGKEVGQCT